MLYPPIQRKSSSTLRREDEVPNINAVNAVVPADGDDYIKSHIFTIRGVQVMLDRDLALLYGVGTKVLNQAVKRNICRFPERYMFQLSEDEVKSVSPLRSQIVTSSWGGLRYLPYAFTEHGIIMLASILRSETAISASIAITDAFVAMRKALVSISPMLERVETIKRRQIVNQQRNEERFDAIFKAMEGGDFPPQKVFFEGKHYDAYSFACKLVKKSMKRIVLIDGYCDETTLDILSQKRGGVDVVVATSKKSAAKSLTPIAIEKFNKQNPSLSVRIAGMFHDRFLIIDDSEIYLLGASLKDLGRRYCAVVMMEASFIPSILKHIGLVDL